MIDFIGKKQWFFLGSAIMIIVMIISLAVFKLQPGIDFTGGTSMTINFTPQVELNESSQIQSQLRQEMAALGYPEASIQFREQSRDFFVRMKFISPEGKDALEHNLTADFQRDVAISTTLEVSPTIAGTTVRDDGVAVVIAIVAMVIYMAWAFRRMPSPFRWGTCAAIALIHDVLVVLGVFAILGRVANVEVDALLITAILTIVGYSINNTVVVFDRIRENMTKGISPDFAVTVNSSIIETLARCLNSSWTVLLVLLALLLFGGTTIHYFVLALFIGVFVGTYTSIFIAGPLLVVWVKGEWKQMFSRLSSPQKAA
jgi:preprotein translocase subunit SecF